MQENTYVAIMAGGIGSRFWPASREERPKQFLDIMGTGKSLIRQTFERFRKLCPPSNIFVVTNKQYAALVKAQIPELSDNQILTEPSRNNTAPCIAYTAFKLKALNPEANLIVAPSDHIIAKEGAFLDALKQGLNFTRQNEALLTLGITPTRPDTGYGYIEVDGQAQIEEGQVLKVASFREKPDLATAEQYLTAGHYFWNAGIFIWRVSALLNAFQAHAPEIYRILGEGLPAYNTDAEQAFIDKAYPATPSISVDYAIMEQSDQVYTLPADIGWSDLGTWASLHAESHKDKDGNAVQGGQAYLDKCQHNLIRTPKDKQVVIGGLEDFIVVDEGGVLLIWPKSREQEIKSVVASLTRK